MRPPSRSPGAPATASLFVSTDPKLGDESELLRLMEGEGEP